MANSSLSQIMLALKKHGAKQPAKLAKPGRATQQLSASGSPAGFMIKKVTAACCKGPSGMGGKGK